MMVTSSSVRVPSVLAAEKPPHGLCWRHKPRLHTWPERYVRIDGYGLYFFKARSLAEVGCIGKAESSSVDDVRGCTVEGGWEDWGLQQLPRVVVSRSDLGKGNLKFCFATAEQRDAFLSALENIAAGRRWNDVANNTAATGFTAQKRENVRQFDLQVVDSPKFCPHGTRLQALVAVDLRGLYLAVSKSVLRGNEAAEDVVRTVRIELLDGEFDEWIGPLTLADVPSTAIIRVKSDERGAELALIEHHSEIIERRRDKLEVIHGGGQQQQQRATQVQTTKGRVEPIVGLRMM